MIDLARLVLIGLLTILGRLEPGVQAFTSSEWTAEGFGPQSELPRPIFDLWRVKVVLMRAPSGVSDRAMPFGACQVSP